TGSRKGPSAFLVAVAGDCDELAQARRELLLPAPLEPLVQHLEDRRLRPAVHEDHEPEAKLLLVDLVQVGELGQDRRVPAGTLLGGRALGEPSRADRSVRVQGLALLLVGQLGDHVVGRPERVVPLREQLDQACPALEELGELLLGQLPRQVVHEYVELRRGTWSRRPGSAIASVSSTSRKNSPPTWKTRR